MATATDIIIPSNPDDRKKINKVIKEISDSKTRAESEREYQKEAAKALSEEYNIGVKWINKAVMDYHKQQFDKKQDENEQYAQFYETVIQGVQANG